jgi:hypothetical protein
VRRLSKRLLTKKLRGCAQAPGWSRGRTLSSRARGDTTDRQSPLQRLLGARENSYVTPCALSFVRESLGKT